MKIQKLVLGEMMVNCYVLGEKNVAVVDPGANAGGILKFLEDNSLKVDKILVTHGHFDHVGALKELKDATNAPVYMHEDDVPMLGDMEKSLGFMMGITPEKCLIDNVLRGGEVIEVEGEKLEVVHTPGHSRGSVSYVGDGFVCSGDLIFKESIGRYDFGDFYREIESIEKLTEGMADDTLILPGHGESTTVIWEILHNPYFN